MSELILEKNSWSPAKLMEWKHNNKYMMHRYYKYIGYDTYLISQYIYFKNNRIWYIIYTYWKVYHLS